MKTKLTLLLIFASVVSLLHAQSGSSKQEDVQEIKNRILIVVTEEPNEKLTAKLQGDQLAQYQKDIEDYNRDIKEVVASFWKFSPTIEYKTRAETDKLTKAKNKKYAYLEYNKFTVNCANAMAYKATYQFKSGTKEITAMGGDYMATLLNVRLCDENPFGPPILGISMPNPYPNKADLVYGLKAMQLHLGFKLEGKKDIPIHNMFKDNAKKLEKLTLLVNEDDIDVKFEDIAKVYPYPVRIVKKEVIDEAILSGDETVAVVMVIPSEGNSFTFLAVAPKDCSVLGNTNDTQSTGLKVGTTISGMPIGNMPGMDGKKSKLKKDHFKLFAKQVK